MRNTPILLALLIPIVGIAQLDKIKSEHVINWVQSVDAEFVEHVEQRHFNAYSHEPLRYNTNLYSDKYFQSVFGVSFKDCSDETLEKILKQLNKNIDSRRWFIPTPLQSRIDRKEQYNSEFEEILATHKLTQESFYNFVEWVQSPDLNYLSLTLEQDKDIEQLIGKIGKKYPENHKFLLPKEDKEFVRLYENFQKTKKIKVNEWSELERFTREQDSYIRFSSTINYKIDRIQHQEERAKFINIKNDQICSNLNAIRTELIAKYNNTYKETYNGYNIDDKESLLKNLDLNGSCVSEIIKISDSLINVNNRFLNKANSILENGWKEKVKFYHQKEKETIAHANRYGFVYKNLNFWASLSGFQKQIFDGNFKRIEDYNDFYDWAERINWGYLADFILALNKTGQVSAYSTVTIPYSWKETENKYSQNKIIITEHITNVEVPVQYEDLYRKGVAKLGKGYLKTHDDDLKVAFLQKFPVGSKGYHQFLENMIRFIEGKKSLQDELIQPEGKRTTENDQIDFPSNLENWRVFHCINPSLFTYDNMGVSNGTSPNLVRPYWNCD